MPKRIVQIQPSSISFSKILCGVKNQMLMLLSSKIKYFRNQKVLSRSESDPVTFKGNNKSKSVSKRVAQCRLQPVIPRNMYKK